MVGVCHECGIRNLITVEVIYIDFYNVPKMNTADIGSFERARRFMIK